MGGFAVGGAERHGDQRMSEEDIFDLYGAVVERTGDGQCAVEYNGLEADDFVSRALVNLGHGYGAVPIGRVDPLRPDLPPHKVAWCRGYHDTTPASPRPPRSGRCRRRSSGASRSAVCGDS